MRRATIRAVGKLARGAAALGLTLAACSTAEPGPAPGELIMVVTTDMALPKDIDTVRIEIVSFGTLQFGADYAVGPGLLELPATLGVVVGKNPADPVTLRVIGKKNQRARTLREVVTTVPTNRVAAVRMPIQWLCDGVIKDPTAERVDTSCSDGETCIKGACASREVAVEGLPSYAEADVFGGGTQSGGGGCFDTASCFAGPTEAPLDLASCSIPTPAGALAGRVNVALQPATAQGESDGVCGRSGCFVVLDGDFEGGWSTAVGPERLALPPGVCAAVARATAPFKVVTSTACTTKTRARPACGPWSSVETPHAEAPDGGSDGATGERPVPAVPGKVACPDARLTCPAKANEGCCWEIANGALAYRCATAAACTGLSNACDGNDDCAGGGAPTCCLDVKRGASCRTACDASSEGARCTMTPAPGQTNGCPASKTCKNCPTRLQVGGRLLAVPICVTADTCPSPG